MNVSIAKKTVLVFLVAAFTAQQTTSMDKKEALVTDKWSTLVSRFFYDNWPTLVGSNAILLAAAVYLYTQKKDVQQKTDATQPRATDLSSSQQNRPEQAKQITKFKTVYLTSLQQQSDELCGYYAAYFALEAHTCFLQEKDIASWQAFNNEVKFTAFLTKEKNKIINNRLKAKKFTGTDVITHFLYPLINPLKKEVRNKITSEIIEVSKKISEALTKNTEITLSKENALTNDFFGDQSFLKPLIDQFPTIVFNKETTTNSLSAITAKISTLILPSLEDAIKKDLQSLADTIQKDLTTHQSSPVTINETYFKENLPEESIVKKYLNLTPNSIKEGELSKESLTTYLQNSFPSASELLDSAEIEAIIKNNLKDYTKDIVLIESAPNAKNYFEIYKDSLDFFRGTSNHGIFIIGTMTEEEQSGHWLTVVAEKKNNSYVYYILNSAKDHPDESIREKYGTIITNFVNNLYDYSTETLAAEKKDNPIGIEIDETDKKATDDLD